MRASYRNILLAVAALLAAGSCSKDESVKYQITDIPISINAVDALTSKALLDATSFAQAGNQIKIYDYYTATDNAESVYIDDYVKSEGPDQAIWPFVTKKYNWTADGEHAFFGWLINDEGMSGEDTFVQNLSYNQDSKTLSVPETVLNQSSPQFDFMYSDVHIRDLNNTPDYVSPVDLKFSHLFTAFGVTAQNNSANTVKLKKVIVKGLKNNNSASVYYTTTNGSEGSIAAYNTATIDQTSTEQFVFDNSSSAITLTNSPLCVSSKDATVDYFLMWPHQTYDSTNPFESATIEVVYDYTDNTNNTTTTLTKSVPLTSLQDWEPGQKNTINLLFKDKEIKLICVVEPWTYEQQEIDFSSIISVSQTMKNKWQNVSSVNYETGEVILKQSTDQEAVVTFQIDSPQGATWTASLIMIEGATDAVQFVDGYKYGKVGELGVIKLKVAKDTPIENRNSYYLRITVQTADGNTIVATGLTGSESYQEFKVIQNLIN